MMLVLVLLLYVAAAEALAMDGIMLPTEAARVTACRATMASVVRLDEQRKLVAFAARHDAHGMQMDLRPTSQDWRRSTIRGTDRRWPTAANGSKRPF